jgi:hypothetical protein
MRPSFVPVQWAQPSDQGRRNKRPISIGNTQPFPSYRTAAIMQRYEDRNMRIHDGWELYCGKVVDRRSLGANSGKLTVPTIARVSHVFLLQTEIPSCGGSTLYITPWSHYHGRVARDAGFSSIWKASSLLVMGMWIME